LAPKRVTESLSVTKTMRIERTAEENTFPGFLTLSIDDILGIQMQQAYTCVDRKHAYGDTNSNDPCTYIELRHSPHLPHRMLLGHSARHHGEKGNCINYHLLELYSW